MAEWASWLDGQLTRFYDHVDHGDYFGWLDAVNRLPEINPTSIKLDSDEIQIGRATDCTERQRQAIRQQLQRLIPWRKGPFNLFGLSIDAEWRSDLKWRRLQDKISPLSDRTVLDVGCGNGYYGWRMLGAGAKLVVGIDSTLKYVMQHRAVARYLPHAPFDVLPFSLGAQASDGACPVLPQNGANFDTVFSMGVIYHRRDPMEHIRELSAFLHNEGELVLESLIIDEDHGDVLNPQGRYAKMRNIRSIPSITTLKNWLSASGFTTIELANISTTTLTEQRVTEWTYHESLTNFLDPENPRLTIEGHPAPKRAIVICNKR